MRTPTPSSTPMTPPLHALPWLLVLVLVLASCSSPPKPPTVDESTRRPANSATAVELQVCKFALQNTRSIASESNRRQDQGGPSGQSALQEKTDSTELLLERLAMHQQAVAALQAQQVYPARSVAAANTTYTLRFGFGSSKVAVPAESTATLLTEARQAPLVLLRGRTDGATDSPADSRIARARAEAVRTYLVNAGVDAARIRTTYQPSGDHAADNASAAGQALNRRVEIELYRALPVSLAQITGLAP